MHTDSVVTVVMVVQLAAREAAVAEVARAGGNYCTS